MEIRIADPKDAKGISALIKGVAHHFTLHPAGLGAESFLETISEAAIESYIRDAHFHYLIGVLDGELAGVVAIRDNKHLHHLFVSPPYQGRGLARNLWNVAMATAIHHGNPGEFTVNSTPYAEAVYTAFGFVPTGSKVETKGIAFVPMRYRGVARGSESQRKQPHMSKLSCNAFVPG